MAGDMVNLSKSIHVPRSYGIPPKGWTWSRLDDVTSGVFDCPHSTPTLTESGPYCVRTQDIITGVFRADLAKSVSEETYTQRTSRAIPTYGDLLYSREGSYFGIAAEVPPSIRVCLGQRMVLIRPDKQRLDFRFLCRWLNSPIMASHIHGYRDGTVAERLNLPTIRALPVILPPLGIQVAIAHILGCLDDMIELNRRMNETLEGIARAFFQSWFVDFDPVRAKLDGRTPYGMDQATADLFPDGFSDSELGPIPRGWQVASLADAITIEGGTQPPANTFTDTPKPGFVRLIQIRDYDTDAHLTFIEDLPKWRTCNARDIMIARYGASVARIRWGLVGAYNVALVKAVPTDNRFREYLRSYLLSDYFQTRLIGMSGRSAQAGFNKGDIASFNIALPPSSLAARYDALAWPLRSTALHNKAESQTLSQLRDTLLPKLLSGELSVDEAGRCVEQAV